MAEFFKGVVNLQNYFKTEYVDNINLKTIANTVIYTVPVGYRLYLKGLVLATKTITGGPTTPHSYKWTAGGVDITGVTVSTATTVGATDEYTPVSGVTYPAGTIIRFCVTTGSIYTTHTGTALLEGVLLNA